MCEQKPGNPRKQVGRVAGEITDGVQTGVFYVAAGER